jgi:carbamoylphosphate synthase large subunit
VLVLDHGPARVKPARGVGGRGQKVVSTVEELDAVLTNMDQTEVANHGVVIEQNLGRVTTFSVGQVRVSDLVVTYYGKQRLTKDSRESDVYGGSDLVVVRGDYEELLV